MQMSLSHKYQEVGDIMSFIFTPHTPLSWLAGQSIKIELPTLYGPSEHRFTIASAPYEKQVMITTRMSGSLFKQALQALKPGDVINAFSIDGQFTWREAGGLQRIFVAAGMGITPFHSILKQRRHKGLPLHVTLIYGATKAHAYKDILDCWQREHPEFTVRYSVGERITPGHIAAIAPLNKSLIYIAGPTAMVDNIAAGLEKTHSITSDRLVRDWFIGY